MTPPSPRWVVPHTRQVTIPSCPCPYFGALHDKQDHKHLSFVTLRKHSRVWRDPRALANRKYGPKVQG